jgi:hypothetical protein
MFELVHHAFHDFTLRGGFAGHDQPPVVSEKRTVSVGGSDYPVAANIRFGWKAIASGVGGGDFVAFPKASI